MPGNCHRAFIFSSQIRRILRSYAGGLAQKPRLGGQDGASHRRVMKNVRGMCEKTYLSLSARTRRCSWTNCLKFRSVFVAGSRPLLTSAACLSVPTGRMRRHSGSAGRLGVTLPADGRTWRSDSKRSGSKQGGSKRGGPERGGTRDTPCGNHPSSSRAATMDSKAHSMSLRFPVSAAATSACPALNQWGRFKYPGGKSAIRACWTS
jgi:hypothetical protein